VKIAHKLFFGFAGTPLLIAVVGYMSFVQLNKIAQPLETDIPESVDGISKTSYLDGLAKFIRYYDEVLTQSARNYAFTEDQKWKQRYRDVEPKLDEMIKEASQKGDEIDRAFFLGIDQANTALVEIESRAIGLVDEGRAAEAVYVLESDAYWKQKAIYELGLRDYVISRGVRYDEALVVSTKAVGLATDKAAELIKVSSLIFLIMTGMVLTLTTGLGILIARSISNPIMKLKNMVLKIGRGERPDLIDVSSGDEIGSLARDFVKLAADIQNTTVSKTYVENIISSMAETLVVVDVEGKIRMVNKSLCDLLGYEEKELIGNGVGMIVVDDDDDDDRPFKSTKLQKLIEEGSLKNHAMTYQTKAGDKISVSFSGAVMKNEEGEAAEFVGIARDMTEQMKTIEAMRKLLSAVEQTGDSVIITDRNGVIEYVNKAFEELSGYSIGEVVGKTPRILKSGKHTKRFYERLWKAILSGEVYRADLINKKKNGALYDEEQVITPIKNEVGEVTHFVVTGRNVTAKKRVQQEMEDARNVMMSVLEDTNEAKTRAEKRERELKETQAMLIQAGKLAAVGQLGAGVAHELNQPIAAIMGFSQLLVSQLPTGSPLVKNLKLIEQQSQRMAKIVDNIRTFSRPSKGERAQVAVNQVIDDSVMLIAVQLKSHKVVIKKELDLDLPLIWANQNQLQQVFINLLTNARDAINEKGGGGALTLTTRTDGKDWIECRIQDTGGGIQEEYQERIFDPFFTTKPPGKGTGLGLSILYGIVEDHAGKINFESEAGKGTTFILRLPVDARQINEPRDRGNRARENAKGHRAA
jgi:PAS domain S-box-containing protein